MCFPGAEYALVALKTASDMAASNAQAKAYARQADRTRAETLEAAERERGRAEKIRSALRVGYARGGVTPDGSPADALEDLAGEHERDVQGLIRRGYAQADDLDTSAAFSRFRARQSLLSAGSVAHSIWRENERHEEAKRREEERFRIMRGLP